MAHSCCNIAVENCLVNSNSSTIITGNDLSTLIKVPRFLALVELDSSIINDTTIPEGFAEIKNIKKTVKLTQCKLVAEELFVEGFIIKDISYVVPDPACSDSDCCLATRNIWKDIQVKVPFCLGMHVNDLPYYSNYPCLNEEYKASYLCNTMKNKCCDKGSLSESPCEKLSDKFVPLNPVPFCELLSYEIIEVDINRKNFCEETNLYNVLTEKLLLKLYITIFVEDYYFGLGEDGDSDLGTKAADILNQKPFLKR